MAASNSSRSRGIHVEEMTWGLYARGTRAALAQHGITLEAPFPGDPGERKTTCKTTDPLGREIDIQRRSKTTFSVHRIWSDEEKVLLEHRRKREQENQAERNAVAAWPKSAGDYRERMRRYVNATMEATERWLDAGRLGGYRFDDAALQRFYEISDELVGMVEAGGIVMDPELRRKATPDCMVDELPFENTPAPEAAWSGGNVIQFRQRRDR
ncbi:MAG: hypothetical protein WC736_16290 [Gallionella sp.]